jgi:hypothetical protein
VNFNHGFAIVEWSLNQDELQSHLQIKQQYKLEIHSFFKNMFGTTNQEKSIKKEILSAIIPNLLLAIVKFISEKLFDTKISSKKARTMASKLPTELEQHVINYHMMYYDKIQLIL